MNLLDKADQEKICGDLLEAKTKVIVHTYDFGFSDAGGSITFKGNAQHLQKCIEDNFNLVEEFGRYQILVRRGNN